MRLNESASSSWLLRALSCGGLVVVVLWGLSLLIASMLGPLRLVGVSQSCASNLKNVTRGFQMYADDFDDVYPPGKQWTATVSPYLDKPDRLHCPAVWKPGEPGFGYAMNSTLEYKPRSKVGDPPRTALLFDSSEISANAHDAVVSLPKPGRHRGRPQKHGPFKAGNNIGYMDGSVRMRFDGAVEPPSAR
jgi:hypothetical protein